MSNTPIAIYDNFDNSLGQFPNYDTYDPGQRTQLGLQKHVDIRSFEQTTIYQHYTMLDLDALHMQQLDGLSMQQLESGSVVQQGEAWTNGTVGPQSDRNYFNGISLSCGIGTTATQSVTQTVNISAFATPDYISLALPAFPLGSLNLASTFIDLSHDGLVTVASLAFSTATLTSVGGDYEARFPISNITVIDTTRINAVRFRISATAPCTFRCLAIRALSSTWQFATIDQNTLYKRLGATVPPSGSLSQVVAFPTAVAPVTPSDWPILLRTDGSTGPVMVDADLGFSIHTGSNLATNTLTVYLRELPMIWKTVGQLESYTMSQLEALAKMPDWIPGNLDDFTNTHSLQVKVQWGSTNTVSIYDTLTAQTFTYTFGLLAAHIDHYVFIQLLDNSVRVQIYPQTFSGVIDWTAAEFDSTAIVDANFNRRRRGRIGWYANIKEGDTYIRQFRPRRIVYGEYRSAPLASVTPAVGAQIYASSTPDQELYLGSLATNGATVTPDVTKSNSGKCLKVQCDGLLPLEGLVTSPITFDNLLDGLITFDVLAPQQSPLMAIMRGEGRLITLNMYPFAANHWSHIEIPLELAGQSFIPGTYSLYILQTLTGANTFYIDNLSIREQSVSWQGRIPAADPWNQNNPAWIKYADQINSPYNGALLGRGNTLQIRGQVVNQLGSIDRVKIIPKYAQLGNFIWSDQVPIYPALPTASFTASINSFSILRVAFDGSASTYATSTGGFYWNFGDGSVGYGQTVTHVFPAQADYVVTLTVIDNLDQKASISQTVDLDFD